jgi:hypothetical protein
MRPTGSKMGPLRLPRELSWFYYLVYSATYGLSMVSGGQAWPASPSFFFPHVNPFCVVLCMRDFLEKYTWNFG